MGPLVLRRGRRTTTSSAVPSTALLVAAVLLLLLTAGPDGAEGYPTYRLCGKHLADILELICKGRGFHDPFANVEPGRRVAYVQTGKGVSDECCKEGCTRRTMESYCSAEPIHHKRLTPERPEPIGDLRHAHRNGVHPEGRESAEEETASSSVSKASSAGPPSSSPEDSSSPSEGRRGGGGRGLRGGRRRKDKGRRRRGGEGEDGGGGKRKGPDRRKCRCKRRRRKTDAEATKRQLSHGSFQIGTISPSYLGTPVILPRGKVPPVLS